MTLGEIIKKYRMENEMSMDVFSEKSGISKAYISVLEKNQHPATGKAIAPSIRCIKQAADGMRMDFDALFSMLDGEVNLSTEVSQYTLTAREAEILAKWRALGDDNRDVVEATMNAMLAKKTNGMEDNINVG